MIYIESVDANTFRMHGDDLTVKPDLYPKEYEASAIKVPNETEPRVVIKHGSLGNEIVTIRDIRALSIDGVVYATAELAVTAFNAMNAGEVVNYATNTTLTDGTQKTKLLNRQGDSVDPNGTPAKISVSLTRPADTTPYSVGDNIGVAAAAVKQKDTITLIGSAPAKHKYTLTLSGTSGTAQITGTGTLIKTITFATGGTLDLAQTANDYYIENAAFYLVEGATLTQSNNTLIFEAVTAGTPIVIPTITNLTGDLFGTVVETTPNVVVGQLNVSGITTLNRNIVWTGATLTTTAAAFVTSFAADYLAEGVVLTSLGDDVIFEASVAGVSYGVLSLLTTIGDLFGTSVAVANVTLSPLTIPNIANYNGGGGTFMDFSMETENVGLAGATLRFWLYTEVPSGVVGDNVALVNSFANADKRNACAYFDCTFDALLAGSDTIIGKSQPSAQYVCDLTDVNLYFLVQTLTVGTPISEGGFMFNFNVIKL